MQERLKVVVSLGAIAQQLTLVEEFFVSVVFVLYSLALRGFCDLRVLHFVQWRLQMRECFEEFGIFFKFLL